MAKKTFDFGHCSLGHRWAERRKAIQTYTLVRARRDAAHAQDVVDLRGLPQAVVERAQNIVRVIFL